MRNKQHRKVGHSHERAPVNTAHNSHETSHVKGRNSQQTQGDDEVNEYLQNNVQVYKAVKRAGKIGSYDGKAGKSVNTGYSYDQDAQDETEYDDFQSKPVVQPVRRPAPVVPPFVLEDPLIQSHLSVIQEEDDMVRDSLASTTASNLTRKGPYAVLNRTGNNNSASNSPKTFNKKSLAKNATSVGASYVADSLDGDAFRNVGKLEKQASGRTNSTSRSGGQDSNEVDAEAEEIPSTARSRAATSEADSIEYGQFVKTDHYDAVMATMADDYNAWDDLDPYAPPEEQDSSIMEDSLQRSKKFNFAAQVGGIAGLQGKPPRSPRREMRNEGNSDMEQYSQYNVIPPDYSRQGQQQQQSDTSGQHSGIPRFTSRKSTPFLKAFDSDGSLSQRVDTYGEHTNDLNSPPRGVENQTHFSPGKPYVPSVRDLLAVSPDSPRRHQRSNSNGSDVPRLNFPREEAVAAPQSMLSKLEQAQQIYATNVRKNFPQQKAPPVVMQLQFPGLSHQERDHSNSPLPLSSRSNSTADRSPRGQGLRYTPPPQQIGVSAPQYNPVAQAAGPPAQQGRQVPQPLTLPTHNNMLPPQHQQQPPQHQPAAQGYSQQAAQRQQYAVQEQQQITPRSIRVTHPLTGPPPMPAQLLAQQAQAQAQGQAQAVPLQSALRRPQPAVQPAVQPMVQQPPIQYQHQQPPPQQPTAPPQRAPAAPKQESAPSGGYFAEYNANRGAPQGGYSQAAPPSQLQQQVPAQAAGRFSSLPSKMIPPAAAKVSLNPVIKPVGGLKNPRKDVNMSQTKLTELQEQKLLEEIEELNRIQLQKLQELALLEEAEKAVKVISPKNGAKKNAKEPDVVKEKEKRAFKAGAKDINPAPILTKLKAKANPPAAAVKAPAVEDWSEAAQRDLSNKAKGKNGLALAVPSGNAGNGGYGAPASPIPNIHLNLAGPNQPLPVELGAVAGGFGAGAGYLQVYKKKQEVVVRNPSNPRGRRGGGDEQDGLSANGDAQSEGRLFQNRRREGDIQQTKYAPAYEETSSLPAIPSARNAKSSGSARTDAIRQAGQGGYSEGPGQVGGYYPQDGQNPPFVHPLDGQNRRVLNSSRNNTMSAPSRLHDQQPDDDSYYSNVNGYANGYNGNGYGGAHQQNMRSQSDRSALPVPVKVSHDYAAPNQQAVPIYNMQKKVSSNKAVAAAGGGAAVGGGYSNKR